MAANSYSENEPGAANSGQVVDFSAEDLSLLFPDGSGDESANAITLDARDLLSMSSEETSDVGQQTDSTLAEDGVYTSKEDVALYIHTYGKLPSNFITKNDAKKLGWNGGGLEEVAPGKSIGGDTFGNYEGKLPEDKKYKECDIDTMGAASRGAKRIVYSDDGYVYYTDDHYENFEQLYEP
ncbi:MAG: ribonuclease [Butyrivibrio sp.]|nr:ribonuclease [Butyrivibrio sp.]